MMMRRRILHIDFETKNMVELRGPKSVGLYNYIHHPSAAALMMGWAFDDEPVDLWQLRLGSMPKRVSRAFVDPTYDILAFNSAFERGVLDTILGIKIPIERFLDPQPCARYLSLPPDLDKIGRILGLNQDYAKQEDSKRLINMFCKPSYPKKKRKEPIGQPFFRDWITDPVDWDRFCEYCKQDVVAEREIARREALLGVFPLPEREQKIWIFDQKVNDRGIPTDRDFVEKAYAVANRAKKEAIQALNELTGLENSNSNTQMLEWAKSRGYKVNSMRKGAVAAALKYNPDLTPLCREAFEFRKSASSTSYKKMSKILQRISPDDRLRNQFIYMGSPKCGRWSGDAVQPHNMARPVEYFEDVEHLDEARRLIRAMDYDGIYNAFKDVFETSKSGTVLLTVKSCIRTAFAAKSGKRLKVCDLNAIETRIAAWVAQCQSLIQVFLDDKDPYLDFAMKMTQIPYEILKRDIKSKDPAIKAAAKGHRQMAKPGMLGCVYRLGGGQMGVDKHGDPVMQGLAGYADGMGIKMTFEQAHEIVRVFREAYHEIPECWYAVEAAIADVLEEGTFEVKRSIGPGGCIKFDKINMKDRKPILRIQLPSGRYLHYMDAYIDEALMPWKDKLGNDVYKRTLYYSSIDQTTKQWTSNTAHGGKTFENIVQGIARDVLAESLLKFENEMDMPVCLHVHDEGGTEVSDDPFAPGFKEMKEQMSKSIFWAPGLPLGAEGFESDYYHK
jgi:DNA polymerase